MCSYSVCSCTAGKKPLLPLLGLDVEHWNRHLQCIYHTNATDALPIRILGRKDCAVCICVWRVYVCIRVRCVYVCGVYTCAVCICVRVLCLPVLFIAFL